MIKTIAACLSALILTACGGYTTVGVSGTVTVAAATTPPQTISGLVIALNGSPYTIPDFLSDGSSVAFAFPAQLADTGAQYAVTVQTQPTGWSCVVSFGTGYTSGIPIDHVKVVCTAITFTVGGTVHNLTSSSLVLANGTDTVTVNPNSGAPGSDVTFTFPAAIGFNGSYNATVSTQPTTPVAQTCTINSGASGTNIQANVTNIDISCL